MRIPAYALRQSGLSLVELMVGMLVGLIGIIIISHLYVTNEQYKRSTTGAGAAQVNGAVALYSIERELRMAGYGINHSGALGCKCAGVDCSPLRYFYNGSYSAFDGATAPPPGGEVPPLTIAPVLIRQTPDLTNSITLLYSGDSERASPNTLKQTMSEPYNLNGEGTAGFETGNLVVVTEGEVCALTQVTVVPLDPQLQRPQGPYNPAANGDLPKFGKGAYLFNLGSNPVWRTYEISKNKLRATNALPPKGGAGGQDLVDDIVDMQALYGKDDGIDNKTIANAVFTPNDGNIDNFSALSPDNADGWKQVLAVRVAVLARSQNYEQPDKDGNCQATTIANQPRWGPRVAATDPLPNTFPKLEKDLKGAVNDAGCYKYRVFETVVPLRNMIWRSS